jgi:hypothetical protein
LRFWLAAAVFAVVRFSEAFQILRARNLGLGEAYAPLVLMNVACVLSAYPAGALSGPAGSGGAVCFCSASSS